MNAHLLVLLSVLSTAFNASAQGCGPVGDGINGTMMCLYTDTIHDHLYCGGAFTGSGGDPFEHVCWWNDTVFNPMGSGTNGAVYCATHHDGNLCAGGSFTQAGGVTCNGICGWDGSIYHPLGSGMSGMEHTVHALCAYDGHLCAGGSFSNAGGASCSNVAMWNGNTWSSLGSGWSMGMDDAIGCLCPYQGSLYCGGSFNDCGGLTANNLSVWNGSTWSALGMGFDGQVGSLAVYNNVLYLGGSFTTADGTAADNIAQFTTTTGLRPLDGMAYFGMYPVPASDHVNITLPELSSHSTLVISTLSGAVVRSIRPNAATVVLDVSSLDEGMYTVTVRSGNGRYAQPLLIAR